MSLCLHRTGAWRLVWLADPLDAGSAAVALRLLDEQVPDDAPRPVPGPCDPPGSSGPMTVLSCQTSCVLCSGIE